MDVNRTTNYGAASAPPPPPSANNLAAVAVAPTEVVTAASDPVAQRQEATREPLQRAVNEINSSIASYRRHLNIRIHEETGRLMVTVYNSDNNEVIREIPPESVLDAHANLLELAGLFVDTRG